ncbi:hypothetical protein TRIUR3_26728 [Triticum urartu]|uniref:Uncharacterized protein n=1 Tax=Triticum urartu TaxID=4572 RepID=M7YR70_TRIUA|nr:hypothetical protein TRIUR3_26728 [Triticum urartu]
MPALRLPLEIKIQEPSPSMDDAGGDILPSLGRVRLGDLAAVEGLASDSYKICVSTGAPSLPVLILPREIKIQDPSPSMDDAGGDILPSLGRVRLGDLAAVEGLASDSYKICVSTLMQSLAQYSAAIIQLPPADAALLRSGLDSARLFFHQPGVSVREHGGAMELSPSGLPDIFSMLGKVCRDILDAVSFSLNLRSCVFTEILGNMPLRSQEVSSSVLSACCHSRPSFEEAQQHGIASPDDSQLLVFSEQEQQIDKALLTLVKSDRSGLYIKDLHGRWILVDGDLGPHDIVVYPGLALYQETSGYVNPAVHKTEVGNLQECMFGRCSLAFKLTPRFVARPGGSEMGAAGHGVDTQFQAPITVTEFMQTNRSADQLFPKNNESSSQSEQDVSQKYNLSYMSSGWWSARIHERNKIKEGPRLIARSIRP